MGEILNKKERDEIGSILNNQFGFDSFGELIIVKAGNNKLWITNREILETDFSKIRTETL